MNFPAGLALDRRGDLFISDAGNNVIRMVDPHGVTTTVVGTGEAGSSGDGGPATEAQLNAPAGIVFDVDGNLYIADQANDVVRHVHSEGVITTIAGVP